MTIRITTTEGTVDLPGTAEEVDTGSNGLRIIRKGQTTAQFRRWLSWHEITEESDTKP